MSRTNQNLHQTLGMRNCDTLTSEIIFEFYSLLIFILRKFLHSSGNYLCLRFLFECVHWTVIRKTHRTKTNLTAEMRIMYVKVYIGNFHRNRWADRESNWFTQRQIFAKERARRWAVIKANSYSHWWKFI